MPSSWGFPIINFILMMIHTVNEERIWNAGETGKNRKKRWISGEREDDRMAALEARERESERVLWHSRIVFISLLPLLLPLRFFLINLPHFSVQKLEEEMMRGNEGMEIAVRNMKPSLSSLAYTSHRKYLNWKSRYFLLTVEEDA